MAEGGGGGEGAVGAFFFFHNKVEYGQVEQQLCSSCLSDKWQFYKRYENTIAESATIYCPKHE